MGPVKPGGCGDPDCPDFHFRRDDSRRESGESLYRGYKQQEQAKADLGERHSQHQCDFGIGNIRISGFPSRFSFSGHFAILIDIPCLEIRPSLFVRPAPMNPAMGRTLSELWVNGTPLSKRYAPRQILQDASVKERLKRSLFPLPKWKPQPATGFATAIPELDRVLGGGIVPGSMVLVGGDPGIGKSTLMMQMGCFVRGQTVLYITGEESLSQVRLRADRSNPHPISV